MFTTTSAPRHLTRKRHLRHPEKWIGCRIDTTKWIVPDGYVLCDHTGKLYPEEQALLTFAHWVFERDELRTMGIHTEDASWLSEDGYYQILDILDVHNRLDYYLRIASGWGEESAPQ